MAGLTPELGDAGGPAGEVSRAPVDVADDALAEELPRSDVGQRPKVQVGEVGDRGVQECGV